MPVYLTIWELITVVFAVLFLILSSVVLFRTLIDLYPAINWGNSPETTRIKSLVMIFSFAPLILFIFNGYPLLSDRMVLLGWLFLLFSQSLFLLQLWRIREVTELNWLNWKVSKTGLFLLIVLAGLQFLALSIFDLLR